MVVAAAALIEQLHHPIRELEAEPRRFPGQLTDRSSFNVAPVGREMSLGIGPLHQVGIASSMSLPLAGR
jgi:hypothetical protein